MPHTLSTYHWCTRLQVEHKQATCNGEVTLSTTHRARDKCCVTVSAECSECGPITVTWIDADAGNYTLDEARG